MKEAMSKILLDRLPIGYVYHELIRRELGEPADLVFLEANSAFEAMTGIARSALAGKSMTEIIRLYGRDSFDWAAFYSGGLPSYTENETVRYIETLGH